MATPQDADAIADIYAPFVRDTAISFETVPPDAQEMRSRLTATLAGLPWLVMTNGDAIVGYAYASPHGERAAYRWSVDVSLYLSRSHHRQGHGRRMYGVLFNVLAAQGYINAYSAIVLPNPASVGLHEAMAFDRVGVFHGVGFKLGRWWDIVTSAGGIARSPIRPRSPATRGHGRTYRLTHSSSRSEGTLGNGLGKVCATYRIEESMSDKSGEATRPLIAFTTADNAPPITPAPISRPWMSAMRNGWPNRCLPMLIANQSGWELRNPCAFTATWMGGDESMGVIIAPDRRDPGQLLPFSHFGHGILTWHLPMLFRTPPGYNLLVRGPANYPKDAVSPLEGVVETDWATSSFSMSWQITRKMMPVRFEVDEPICMIVPQRRAELEEFAPEIRPIESDEDVRRKHEFFLRSRNELGQAQAATNTAVGEKVPWQGDYTRGRHSDGEAGAPDHQTRIHLRPFVETRP